MSFQMINKVTAEALTIIQVKRTTIQVKRRTCELPNKFIVIAQLLGFLIVLLVPLDLTTHVLEVRLKPSSIHEHEEHVDFVFNKRTLEKRRWRVMAATTYYIHMDAAIPSKMCCCQSVALRATF